MPGTRVPARSRPDLPDRLKPRKTPRQARSAATVEAVLEAATRILVSDGWPALTTNAVAERAGVSIGSLYQYFPDRASLAAALLERYSDAELAAVVERQATLPAGGSLADLAEAVVRAQFRHRAAHRPLHLALLAALPEVGRHAGLVARAAAAFEGFRQLLHARAPHVDPARLDAAAHVLANAIHSLTHDGVVPQPATLDDARLEEEAVRLVRAYLATLEP